MMRTAFVAALIAFAVAGCGGGGTKSNAGPPTTANGTTTQSKAAGGACPVTGKPVSFPLLDAAKKYTVVTQTTLGTFAFSLDVKHSPCTTSSFASLVRKHFFDGLTFHRVVHGFVIQGGDPKGNGTGGPGYSVKDVPPANAAYGRGVVAMAKTGLENAGTSGSQFFIVTGADAGLPPLYALLGKVTRGLAVVERIGRTPTDTNEHPLKRVVIRRMTVTP